MKTKLCPECQIKQIQIRRTMCDDCYFREASIFRDELTKQAKEKLKEIGLESFLKLKVKDRVRDVKDNLEGIVTEIIPFDPENMIEDHGFITVLLDDQTEEHYVHWNWISFLEIVN